MATKPEMLNAGRLHELLGPHGELAMSPVSEYAKKCTEATLRLREIAHRVRKHRERGETHCALSPPPPVSAVGHFGPGLRSSSPQSTAGARSSSRPSMAVGVRPSMAVGVRPSMAVGVRPSMAVGSKAAPRRSIAVGVPSAMHFRPSPSVAPHSDSSKAYPSSEPSGVQQPGSMSSRQAGKSREPRSEEENSRRVAEKVRECVFEGANVMYKSSSSSLPILTSFIDMEEVEAVAACLDSTHAIDFTITDSSGHTPLQYLCLCASLQNGLRMLELLLKRLHRVPGKDRLSWGPELPKPGAPPPTGPVRPNPPEDQAVVVEGPHAQHFLLWAANKGRLAPYFHAVMEEPYFVECATRGVVIDLSWAGLRASDWRALTRSERRLFRVPQELR